jgi:hypothetical protein
MQNRNRPPSLHELQSWMKWILTDPRGVKEALANPYPADGADLERYTSPAKTIYPWITDAAPIDRIARLDIYAEGYFSRILASLQSDFPITARVVGDISFQKLIADYLKVHFSRSANIGEIGQHLSRFALTYPGLKEAPFLSSLIEMEWLLIECFYAENSGFLEPSKLGLLTDEDWAEVRFEIAPHVRLLESNWSLDHFWKLRQDSVPMEKATFDIQTSPTHFLLGREKGDVFVEKIGEPQFLMLQFLSGGKSLVKTLEETENRCPDQENASEIMATFHQWVQRGIICGLERPRK